MTTNANDGLYEIDLTCGDTVSTAVLPRLGAYRTCIHCDSRKRVTAIRAPWVTDAPEATQQPAGAQDAS